MEVRLKAKGTDENPTSTSDLRRTGMRAHHNGALGWCGLWIFHIERHIDMCIHAAVLPPAIVHACSCIIFADCLSMWLRYIVDDAFLLFTAPAEA